MRGPRHWPGGRRIALAMALGLAMAAGQAPFGLWPVALAALAGLIALVAGAGGHGGTADTAGQGDGGDISEAAAFLLPARRGAGWWVGWFAGAGYFAGSLNWIYEPFLVDADAYGWMAPFAVLGMAFGLGLFWGAAGWLAGALSGRTAPGGGCAALAFAATLSAAELARSYVMTGFPWALIGHIWIGSPVAQAAALIGPVGLTLATCLVAAGLARLRPASAGAAVLALAAAWAWGAWRLSLPDPVPQGAVIRLVQPDAVQSLKWDPEAARTYFDRQVDYTAAPGLDGGRPDLVIWPETAMPYLLERSPEVAGIIAAAGQGAPVALGLQRIDAEGRGYNTLAVIGPGGEVTARYDKWHLVPFGEYIPLGDLAWRLFGIGAFASQMGAGYTAGPGPALIDLGPGLGRALPLICYEAVFPQDLRAVPERAGWLLQITNDAWFGTLTGPYQHLGQARLRAIEQGLPLARAANTGISAMIDARGRVTAALPLGRAGWIDAPLPGALPATIYARTGDLPAALVILSILCALLWRRRRAGA